jgi:site-specific recombinase XerD
VEVREVKAMSSGLSLGLKDFEGYLSSRGLSSGTIGNYSSDVRVFLRWVDRTRGEAFSLSGIERGDVEDYLAHLKEQGRRETTMHRFLQGLRRYFDFSVEAGHVVSNPAREVKFTPKGERHSPRVLTEDEVGRLLAAVARGRRGFVERDCAIVQLLLEAGIRPSELIGLRVVDVILDGESAVVAIRAGNRPRRIPLGEAGREAIGSYLKVRKPLLGVDRLFVTRSGGPFSKRAVQKILAIYSGAAGLEGVSANTLRNTYAKRLLDATGDLALVARRLGHNRLETTLKYVEFGQDETMEMGQEVMSM